MNRELKFRAYHHHDKKMYEVGAIIRKFNDENYNRVSLSGREHVDGEPLNWRVDGKMVSVTQFVGLHDKNGKDVYHKDFIKSGKKIYLVEWQKEEARFFLSPIKETFDWQWMDMVKSFEVIGNVFENPKLLTP